MTISMRRAGGAVLAALLVAVLAMAGRTPAGATGPTYVALGDSYASGDGAPPYDAVPANCHRATGAWPRLLAADVPSIGSVDLEACGGAQTKHVTGPWPEKKLPPQLPATPDPSVTLVTLVIGGNDVGVGNMLNSCWLFSCPSPTSLSFTAKLATLKTTLVTKVYPAIHAAYPNARVAHVGYPQITPAPGIKPVGCSWLSAADQKNLAGIIDAIDSTIQAATVQAGTVTFVGTRGAMAGHEMCTAAPWINPMGGAQTPAHPNAQGQHALELSVASGLGITIP